MIEIGRTKIVRRKSRKTGEVTEKVVSDRLTRVTRDAYGHTGRKRKLVVVLESKDLITIKPLKSRTEAFSGNVWDIYYMLVRGQALKKQLEKARAKQAKMKAASERRRIADADRRIRMQARRENMARV